MVKQQDSWTAVFESTGRVLLNTARFSLTPVQTGMFMYLRPCVCYTTRELFALPTPPPPATGVLCCLFYVTIPQCEECSQSYMCSKDKQRHSDRDKPKALILYVDTTSTTARLHNDCRRNGAVRTRYTDLLQAYRETC